MICSLNIIVALFTLRGLLVKESRFEGLKIFIIDGQDVVELQEAKEANI